MFSPWNCVTVEGISIRQISPLLLICKHCRCTICLITDRFNRTNLTYRLLYIWSIGTLISQLYMIVLCDSSVTVNQYFEFLCTFVSPRTPFYLSLCAYGVCVRAEKGGGWGCLILIRLFLCLTCSNARYISLTQVKSAS